MIWCFGLGFILVIGLGHASYVTGVTEGLPKDYVMDHVIDKLHSNVGK